MVCHVHWFLADFGVPFSITATTWLALVFAPLYSKVHFWNVHMADHEERLHNVGTVLRTVSANASATVRKVAISTLSAHKSAFVGNPSWLDWSLTGIWRQSLHSYVCWSVYTLVHSHCLAQTRRSNCHFRIFAWLGLRLWGPTQVCHWLSENLLEQRLAGAYEVPWHVSFQIQSLSSSSKCTNRTVQFNREERSEVSVKCCQLGSQVAHGDLGFANSVSWKMWCFCSSDVVWHEFTFA